MDAPPQDQKNIFMMSKKNTAEFFGVTKKTSQKYNKSIMKLQQNYIDVWKNVINAAISLELGCANNAVFLTNISESDLQIICDMTELSIQAYLRQNKFLFDRLTMTKQSFTTFSYAATSFAGLNKEIMGYLMSICEPKSRTQVIE